MTKLTGIVLILAFIIGGITGYLLNARINKQDVRTEIIDSTHTDTLYLPQEPIIHVIEKRIPVVKEVVRDSIIYPSITVIDTISGNENDVEYNVEHRVDVNIDSARSQWDVEIKPLVKLVTENSIQEKTKTVLQYKYVTKPFFMDEWFWTTLLSFATAIAAILI